MSPGAKQPPGREDNGYNASGLLTMAEAARALRVSARTIARMVADGRLEGFRVGRLVRIPQRGLPGSGRMK
jgi:excisionase family DNA binding protein